MKKIMHKGDDFLSISETINEMVIQMGLIEINNGSRSDISDCVSDDFSIEVKKIRNKGKVNEVYRNISIEENA